jgi:hypothetical protein
VKLEKWRSGEAEKRRRSGEVGGGEIPPRRKNFTRQIEIHFLHVPIEIEKELENV